MPAPWSVLGGQAGHEEQLRTKHLPSLEPPGGPGQVRPNVGPLSAFCRDSHLVLSYPAGPQRGGSRLCQGKGKNYKGAPRGPPMPQLGGPHRVHSSQHKRPRAVPQYPQGVPIISLTGAPGTRRPRQKSEAHVLRSESRGGPGSTRSEGIVLLVEMRKLRKPEEDLQDPGEAHGLVEGQLLGAEVREATSPSASSSTVSSSAPQEALPQEALKEMITNLMNFLLLKYRAKELTSQAEMLKKVLKDNQEHFPVVSRQASACLQLVFGVEVREVYPRKDTYGMIPALGLTCDAVQRAGQGLPKAGLLVLVLSLIMRNGDPAPEEVVWGALSRMGVYVGRENPIFGEPRELLTQVWVWEGYLEYRQVADSDPARYEFLWGPRAYAETSKEQVMAFVLRVKQKALRAFPLLSAEAAREEE